MFVNDKSVLFFMIYSVLMLLALVWIVVSYSWQIEKLQKDNQKLSAYIEVITHPDIYPINRKEKPEANK